MNQTQKSSRTEEIARVWEPESNWVIPTANGEVTFNFPAFGRDTYDVVVKQVIESKQRLPTGEQIAFMLDKAHNSPNEEIYNEAGWFYIREIIRGSNGIWIPSVNIWTPMEIKNPGMYSVFDENGEGLSRERSIEELEDKLSGGQTEKGVRFSTDRKVAFAPLSTINGGSLNKGLLSNDGAFIAKYGVEGAKKIDVIASRIFPDIPYSGVIKNNSNKPIQTLSTLIGGWYMGGARLGTSFNYDDSKRKRYCVIFSVSCSK